METAYRFRHYGKALLAAQKLRLNERQRIILEHVTTGGTLESAGAELGITRERCRQLIQPLASLLPQLPTQCTASGCKEPVRSLKHLLCPLHYSRQLAGLPEDGGRKTAYERIMEKVDRRGPDECWPWTVPWVSGRPYVTETLRRNVHRHVPAARVILAEHQPPSDPALFALHTCDNAGCCNPAHLYWGTVQDNIDDRSNGKPWKRHLEVVRQQKALNRARWADEIAETLRGPALLTKLEMARLVRMRKDGWQIPPAKELRKLKDPRKAMKEPNDDPPTTTT